MIQSPQPRVHGNSGKPKSEATKQKMSAARKAYCRRQRRLYGKAALAKSKKWRRKLSESMKRYWVRRKKLLREQALAAIPPVTSESILRKYAPWSPMLPENKQRTLPLSLPLGL